MVGSGIHEICSGCRQTISDRYIMRVMDNSWHESCLQCQTCSTVLTRTCYARDCKIYCKSDYDKLFATKCAGCLEAIPATEMVMRALDSVYHLSCFQCIICGHRLEKGDQFVLRSGRLFCRPDFEKEMALIQLQSSQASEDAVIPLSNSQNSPVPSSNNSSSASITNLSSSCPRQDGRRGPKRPRTILTTAQRRAFKASFEISQKPCRKVRESLAKETGLSVRIVQVWFQNQRAKLKKIQRKQQQLQSQQGNNNSGCIDTNGQSSDKSSGDKLSPFSRLGRVSSGHLSDSSADSNGYISHMQYLTHSPDGSYYSNHEDGYSKDVGLDSESSFNGLDDVMSINHPNHGSDDSSLHHHPGQDSLHAHHAHHHSGSINNNGNSTPATIFDTSMTPIDKLYSMQNSYFSSATECECLGASN